MSLTTHDAIEGWRSCPVEQDPGWPDPSALRDAVARLRVAPPVVSARQCDVLRDRLGEVARGRMVMVQGGHCAELLDEPGGDSVVPTVQTLLQMGGVLGYASELPVTVVGRIAGQYAKPRSLPVEVRDGTSLPAYRGDAVNGREFTPAARTPDPRRLVRTHAAARATVRCIEEMISDDRVADPTDVHRRNEAFVSSAAGGERFRPITDHIGRALALLSAHGVDPDSLGPGEFFVSHEALLLDYESALTRRDPDTGHLYDLSAHLVWIGERTRRIDGAHVEFVARIRNPVAVKLGPGVTADEVLQLVERLDPDREPGRLTFVVRMGAGVVRDRLPALVDRVGREGARVAWICDPMHGNTVVTAGGHKTRHFDDVLDEVSGFVEVHRALGTHPGGVHVELTGEDVTECVGGGEAIAEDDLHLRYRTACDPRLNRAQALELAFRMAESSLDRRDGRG